MFCLCTAGDSDDKECLHAAQLSILVLMLLQVTLETDFNLCWVPTQAAPPCSTMFALLISRHLLRPADGFDQKAAERVCLGPVHASLPPPCR